MTKIYSAAIAHACTILQNNGQCPPGKDEYCNICCLLDWQRENIKGFEDCTYRGAKRAAKAFLKDIPEEKILEALLKELTDE
ncbi:MAG TPA: hypothetical protein P5136_01520 [Methanofastidiosum sp.]|nr:hypothetical protein [Methanofastidiosum sp.]